MVESKPLEAFFFFFLIVSPLWVSEDNVQTLALFFHPQVMRLCVEFIYALKPFAGPALGLCFSWNSLWLGEYHMIQSLTFLAKRSYL